jgi:16S rRNA (cytidine1402-2'-O)-methyltransferase
VEKYGTFYLVATPIGNLEDITFRAIKILKYVDKVFAEDTRISLRLLSHYNITKSIESLHSYNESKKIDLIKRDLKEGKNIAYLCDSGTPCISDPGSIIVRELTRENLPIIIIPGPSSVTSSIALSGFGESGFVFLGFLPRRRGDIKKRFSNFINIKEAVVFFESPKRLKNTLQILLEIIGDRECVIIRELTKKYEEILHGTISTLNQKFENRTILGEITVVIDQERGDKHFTKEIDINNMNLKNLIKLLSKSIDIDKRTLYKEIVRIKNKGLL